MIRLSLNKSDYNLWVRPNTPAADQLIPVLDKPLAREFRVTELLRRPGIGFADLAKIDEFELTNIDPAVSEQVEIQLKYAGYIERQQVEISRQKRSEDAKIPAAFKYEKVKGLSTEVCEKLQQIKPENIGQAGRVPGVTPAAISLILVYLKKYTHHELETL